MKTKMDELIAQINYYAQLAKKRSLSKEEEQKRNTLRKEYLAIFKDNFKKQLETIKLIDDNKQN